MLTGVTQIYLESELVLDGSLFDPEHKLFLSFVLEHDYYGIPIEYITEVKSWSDVKVRPLVKAPDFLLGVFNLRGNIVPVVDLRKKWDCINQDFDSRTAVIILAIKKHLWAIVVDSIKEVAGLKKEQILIPPSLNAKLDVRYFLGIAYRNESTLMLLDIEKVMTSEEMGLIEQEHESAQ
jgi:purine-binding chemotaxis protein CheW